MKKTREIPKQNYIKLFLVLMVSILIVLYLASWYLVGQSNNDAYINDTLTELNEADLDSYIIDNPNAIVYFSNNNSETDKIEKELVTYINDAQLTDKMVYIDDKAIESNDFYYNFTNKYFSKELIDKNVSFSNMPNIVVFEEGKVVDIIIKETDKVTIEDIKSILSKYEVKLDA